MKFIAPSFDILTDISDGGIKELKHIERCGRVSYWSEDKITEDGESAKKFVAMLIRNGHESVLEHGSLTVEFTVDRAIANELVRHRMASYTQESTRYCNYSKDKFGGDVTYILPYCLKHGYAIWSKLNEEMMEDDEYKYYSNYSKDSTIANASKCIIDYANFKYGGLRGMIKDDWDALCKFTNYYDAADCATKSYLASITVPVNFADMDNVVAESTPEEARWMLPLGLATRIVVTANYREWKHIFKLRCEKHAHPEMRRIMCALWSVLNVKIPVVFEDIRPLVNDYLGLDDSRTCGDAAYIACNYYRKEKGWE